MLLPWLFRVCVCVSLDGSTSVENHHQWLYLKVMVFIPLDGQVLVMVVLKWKLVYV